MKFLRRLGWIQQTSKIAENRAWLQTRQKEELQKLSPLSKNVDQKLLTMKLSSLQKLKQEEVFNTFTCRNLIPSIRKLNGLADVNITRALIKNNTGIPFTVKDHLKVEGMIETCGFSSNITASNESAQVVELLQKSNCIAYGHSNVPQGLIGIQSANRVYGLAKNPYKDSFISGGSSGGEAVQVATKSSAFGVCSDSGGSVRIPAAFSGVYGFKPSGSKRLSVKGRVGPTGQQGPIISELDPCFGFITRSVDDTAWLCDKTIGKSTKTTNFYLYGGEWDSQRYEMAKNKKIKFGYIIEDHEMQVHPAIRNSIVESIELLRKDGHEVVEFTFPNLHKFRNFFFEFIGNTSFLDAASSRLNQERPVIQSHVPLFGQLGLLYLKQMASSKEEKDAYQRFLTGKTTVDLFGLLKEKNALKTQFLRLWREMNLDILITPVMPFTAPLAENTKFLVQQLTFSCFQNILELPAISIPTRLVEKGETIYNGSKFYEKQAQKSIKNSEGLPVSIQFSGIHLKDEECLGAAWQFEKLLGKSIEEPHFRY